MLIDLELEKVGDSLWKIFFNNNMLKSIGKCGVLFQKWFQQKVVVSRRYSTNFKVMANTRTSMMLNVFMVVVFQSEMINQNYELTVRIDVNDFVKDG